MGVVEAAQSHIDVTNARTATRTQTERDPNAESRKGYKLVGELFGLSATEAQEKFYDISRRFAEWHNRRLRKDHS